MSKPSSPRKPHAGLALASLLLLVWACGAPADRADHPLQTLDAQNLLTPLEDSLALRAPDGTEVWFADSRVGTPVDGRPCIERVMEIRRDGERIAVPLLYTGEKPELIDDSTMRAHIWLNCRPGNTYDVNLRSGEPRRVE